MAISSKNVKQPLEICDDSQVQEELDVLNAIFIDEIQEERDENGRPVSISMQLHPATAQDLQKQFVCVLLELTLPPDYPDEPPEIVMKNPRGLGDDELLGLQEAMHDLARERRGGPMLYELIEMAKESLTEGNIPRCPCVICLDHFNDGDMFTRTTCYHYYHNYCLGKYIQYLINVYEADPHSTVHDELQIYCPVCREPLTYDLDILKASPPPIGDDIPFEITPDIIRQQCEMESMLRNQKAKGGIIDVEAEKNKLFIPSTQLLVSLTTEEPFPNLDSGSGKKKPKVDAIESRDRKPSRREGYGRVSDNHVRSKQSNISNNRCRNQFHNQRKSNREEKYDAYYKHRRRNENRSTNGSNSVDQQDLQPDERDRDNLKPDRRKIELKQNEYYSNESDECTSEPSNQFSVQNENERTQFVFSKKIYKKGDNYERRPAKQFFNNKTSSQRKDYDRYKNEPDEYCHDKENPRGSRRQDHDDKESSRVSRRLDHDDKENPRISRRQDLDEKENPRISRRQDHDDKENPRISRRQDHDDTENPRVSRRHDHDDKENSRVSRRQDYDDTENPRVSRRQDHDDKESSRVSRRHDHDDTENPRISRRHDHDDKEHPRISRRHDHDDTENPRGSRRQEHDDKESSRVSRRHDHDDIENPRVSRWHDHNDKENPRVSRRQDHDDKESSRVSRRHDHDDKESSRVSRRQDHDKESSRVSRQQDHDDTENPRVSRWQDHDDKESSRVSRWQDHDDKDNPTVSRWQDYDDTSVRTYKDSEHYSKVIRADMSSTAEDRKLVGSDRTSQNCASSKVRTSDWRPRDNMREEMSEKDRCQSEAIKERRPDHRQQPSCAKNEKIETVVNKYHAKMINSSVQQTNKLAVLDSDEQLTNEMAACALEINETFDSNSFCLQNEKGSNPSSIQQQTSATRDVFQNGRNPEGRVTIRGRGFSKIKKEPEDSKSLSDISKILMTSDSDRSESVCASEWVPKGLSQIKSASSTTKSSTLTEDVKPSSKCKAWIPNDLSKRNHDVGKTISTGPPGFKVTRPPPGFQLNANDYRSPPGFGRVS